MPDFAMWGPAQTGGFQGIQQLQQTQLSQLAMQETAQDMQLKKQQSDLQKQQFQMKQREEQFKMQQQIGIQKMAMEHAGATLPELARLAFGAGYIDAGEKIAEASAKIGLQQAQTTLAESKAQEQKVKIAEQMVNDFETHLGDIHSQEDYDLRVRSFERATGQSAPDFIKGAKWSPELKSQLEEQALSMKDRVALARQQLDSETRRQLEQQQMRLDSVKEDTERAKQQELSTRGEREKKAGGTKNIPKADFDMALGLIKQDFPELVSENPNAKGKYQNNQAELAAQLVTREAHALTEANPGMTFDQALTKSYADAKARKEIGNITTKFHQELFGFKIPGSGTEEKEFKVNPSAGPAVGSVVKGYRFKGGDPSDKNSWEKL